MYFKLGQSVFFVLLLTNCSLIPEYHRQVKVEPQQWKNQTQANPVADRSMISERWWQLFGSVELNQLVSEALKNNLDLAASGQRIEQSRAQARIAGAPLWPAISAGGNYEHNSSTRSDERPNAWQGQWNMSYEVDLWGAIRAGRNSAYEQLNKARYAFDALQLVVMGDISQAYFIIVGLRERMLIAENNLNNISEVLDIIKARFEAGSASALEVAQQQTELANAAAAVAQLDKQIAQSENALAVLLGRAPQQFKVSGSSLQGIRIPSASLTQPSALMDNRPDIRSAEADLIAAHADIGKARAAFYPRLQLGADNIFTAATMSQPAGIAITLASSLTTPIFQGGRLEGELDRTQARRTELLETYRKTILVAYQEVEDALALGNQSTRRHEHLKLAADSATLAYNLARDRFLAGAIDYQTLLNVQRSLLTAQDSKVQAQVDVLTAGVLLFKSLGGGWNSS
jgi:outer membrane protein, multidrug efflux system